MKTRTNVKAGGSDYQHNESMKVRSNVKAGGTTYQHNESMKRNDHRSPRRSSIHGIKAGM